MTIEMLPVSSETTIAILLSAISETPNAARCLVPASLGKVSLSARGRTEPAVFISLSLMTTAPSWRGEFGKNKFSSNCRLTSA